MELSAPAQSALDPAFKLPLVRNAWLVNLFAFVTLTLSAALVAYLNLPNEAETSVLVGVAGSAYTVLQTWSLLLCSRALRQGPRFLSPYFALLVSLLLFNTCIMAISFSSSLTIHPIREGLYRTALPMLSPLLTFVLLLTLPVARGIALRWPRLSPRARNTVHTSLFGTLALLLVPVPLFIYLAQFITVGEERGDPSPILMLWKPLVRATPEFLADAAYDIASEYQIRDGVLRTGCLSERRLRSEVRYMGPIAQAVEGLEVKNPDAALDAGLALARTPLRGSFGILEGFDTIARLAVARMPFDELAALMKDRAYETHFRNTLFHRLSRRYPEQAPTLADELASQPGLEAGTAVFESYASSHSAQDVLNLWERWIVETDSSRADLLSKMYRFGSQELRPKMLAACLARGSDNMQFAVLRRVMQVAPRTLAEIQHSQEILVAKLESTESQNRNDSFRADLCAAMLALTGSLRGTTTLDEPSIRRITRQVRALIDARKNSASQPAPAE